MRKWRWGGVAAWALAAALGLTGCGSTTDDKAAAPALDTSANAEYPNGQLLVAPDALERSLGAENLVIVDARAAGYAAAHIPGAVHLNHGDFWAWGEGLKPVAEVEQRLGAAGLTRNATIVIYDDTTASWGAAGRIFWMLEYLGCTDVHVLNGGWDKWVADGRRVQSAAAKLAPATFTAELQSSRVATTDHVAKRLYDRDFVVVDTRTDEEFQGWQLYGEARGGHIPGAVQIPYAWLYNADKTVLGRDALKALLESRGVTPDKEVIAHCTVGIRSGFAYFALRLLGYPRCSNYDASIVAWAARDDLPLEKAPRFSTAVYPKWVHDLIEYHKPGSTSAAPPEYPYGREHTFRIFETQWGSFDDMAQGWADDSYLRGHIPGAVHSNSDTYENGYPRWFLLPDDELVAAAGSMGITADTTVVVYSDSPIFAARLWWILKYLGVEDVRYLNGGIAGWTAAGYATETAIREPVPAVFEGTVRPELRATTEYVSDHYEGGDTLLADVRTGSEFAGVISGYGYLDARGRIPGAVWAYDADDGSVAYNDADGTLRSLPEVSALWNDLGVDFAKEVLIYCGGGYRSSLAYLYAYLMGRDGVRNYSDGWAGWSTKYTDLGGGDWLQEPSGRPVASGWPAP